MPRVELHIEEVILQGLPVADGPGIADALQQELTRLLTRDGIPAAFGEDADIADTAGAGVTVASGERPGALGRKIARAVYGALRL